MRVSSVPELRLMLKLMDRVPEGVGPMLKDLEEHISSAGLADMMAAVDVITQDSEKYVERLLELFRRFSTLVKEAFDDDPRFLTARDKAYKLVVNDATVFRLELPSRQGAAGTAVINNKPNNNNNGQPESKCPELLANYCDMLLRKTPLSKKLTSDEIESKLRDVVSFFSGKSLIFNFSTHFFGILNFSSLFFSFSFSNTYRIKMSLCDTTKPT